MPIINTELENVNFIFINFVAELVEEDIKEMNYNSLRDEKLIKKTLEIFEGNKIYPLDIIEILKK